MFKLNLLLLIGWLSSLEVFGQSLSFEHITVDNGLSQNSVRGICQDSLGYIWFGTQNGLNRFDGYKLETFESDKNDTLTIPSNFINTLYTANNGELWIGTNHGLCFFDQKSGQFRRMNKYFGKNGLNGQYIFFSVLKDSKDAIWTIAEGTAIHLFKKENHHPRFQEVLVLEKSIGNATLDLNGQLMEDQAGNLWIGTTKSGLWKFEAKEKKFRKVFLDGENDYSITAIVEDQEKTIWVGTFNDGVFRHDAASDEFTPVTGLNDQAIKSMYVDPQGKLWVGTDKGGLNLYHPESEHFTFYDHNVSNSRTLLHNSVFSIFRDRQNILWVGTYAGGVSYSNPATGAFRRYEAGADSRKNLSNNIVTGFAEDRKGNIWIGTDRGGLNYFDRKTNSFLHYRKNHSVKNSISSDIIRHVLYTSRDHLWIATWLGGLNYFDQKTRRFYTYFSETGNPASISSNTINYLFEDSDKNLWIGGAKGLDLIDLTSQDNDTPPKIKVTRLTSKTNDTRELSDNCVNIIYEDHKKRIWIGTKQGLNLYNRADTSFLNYRNNPASKKIFTNDYVQSIIETKGGVLLIGTYENGLHYYKPWADSLLVYNKSNGFPSNSIIGILEGSDGNYWISTTNGLIKFDASRRTYSLYNRSDGLQSNEFKENAYYRLRNGEMLFGGTNGFNLFHPDSVRVNKIAPAPVITKFKLFNTTVIPGKGSPLQRDISVTKKIVLHHDQSFIGFDFTALNFTIPQKNQYAYMLQGIDKDWNYVGDQRAANYAYVPPGEYIFKLKSANNDGIWSEHPVELLVIINPPWWSTSWFKIASAIGMIGLLWGAFKLRTMQLYARKKVLEQTVKVRTQELEETNHLLSDRQREILLQKEEIKAQRDSIEQQYNTIQSLSEIGQKITASIKPKELITQMYTIINTLMDASCFSIGYYNNDRKSIAFSILKGYGATIQDDVVDVDENRLSVWCLNNKSTLVLADLQAYVSKHFPTMRERYFADSGYQSAIYLPIDSRGKEATEILIVKSPRKNSYTQVHLNTLKNLTAYIAIALDNARVYKEMEAQSEVLRKQSAKLEELDRMKTRFFINISHELRTPLTLILGPLQKMLERDAITDWPRMHRQLAMMNRNATQLQRLINELLEIRNIESAGVIPVSLSESDIIAFTAGIIARFGELAKQHNLRFNLLSDSNSILLSFDKNMMEKVFLNLYSNACKYTPFGGQIDTFLGFEHTNEGSFVKIVIEDTGVGIPDNEIPYLFERFYHRSEPVNYCQESTGIGLSFVRDLIHFHSGKIEVRSCVNEGTAFTILLPLKTGHFHEKNGRKMDDEVILGECDGLHPDHTVTGFHQKKAENLPMILLVEDNPDVRDFVKMELDNCYDIMQACNGKEGFDLALQHIPDLIISDIMMPVMDGIQLCKMVKADDRTGHIPLVLLTAKSGEESQIEGLNIGADDYVEKPFNIRILNARIENLIASRKKLHAIFSPRENLQVGHLIENNHDRAFVVKVDKAIQENIKTQELNHEFLAREIGMSKTQLYRKLQAITGNTVHQYIRNYRLRCADDLLRTHPDMLIFEIAYEVGFKDHAYFSKCFHSFFNFSPHEKKKMYLDMPKMRQ